MPKAKKTTARKSPRKATGRKAKGNPAACWPAQKRNGGAAPAARAPGGLATRAGNIFAQAAPAAIGAMAQSTLSRTVLGKLPPAGRIIAGLFTAGAMGLLASKVAPKSSGSVMAGALLSTVVDAVNAGASKIGPKAAAPAAAPAALPPAPAAAAAAPGMKAYNPAPYEYAPEFSGNMGELVSAKNLTATLENFEMQGAGDGSDSGSGMGVF